MTGPTLRWGLIGASTIARSYMVKAIRDQPSQEIVAVSSGSRPRAESFAADHGIETAYQGTDDLLADPRIDAVYISSINSQHAAQTIAAAAAGKHVLCEKPVATSVADGVAMVTACAWHGVAFGVNYNLRSAAANRAARAAIESGAIGEPLSARAQHAVYLPDKLQTWRVADPGAGAGVALDVTVHDVDLLRYVLQDEVVQVSGMTANQGLAKAPIEDSVTACLRFSSGVLATISDAFNVPHAPTSLEVHGQEGSILITDAMADDPVARAYLLRDDQRLALAVEPDSGLYHGQVRQFEAAVRGEGNPTATGIDGVNSLATALAVLEAAKQVVTLPPIDFDSKISGAL